MKKLGLIIAGLLIMSLLVSIVGCAQPTPPPPPAEEEEEEEEVIPPPEEPFKPIKIKYAWPASLKPSYFQAPSGYQIWADCVKEATDGRLIVELYPNESLHKVTAAFEACAKGVSDMAWGYPPYTPGILPMEGILSLPPLIGTSAESEMHSVIYFMDRVKPGAESLYTKFLEKYWHEMGLKTLAPMSLEPYILFSARKPINKIEDLKGLTMRAHSAEVATMLKPLGVLSISITYADAYEALQKGIMDVAGLSWGVPLSYGWYEVAKPGYIIECGGATISLYHEMINEPKWESLPLDLQKTLAEITWFWLGLRSAVLPKVNQPTYEAEYTRLGIQTIHWSDAEKQRFNEIKAPRWDVWISDMEAKYQKGAEATEMVAWWKDQLAKFEFGQTPANNPEMGGDVEAWKALIGPMGTDVKRGPGKLGPGGTIGLGFEYYPGIKFQFHE